jgi:hypothetical protein
MGRTVEELLSEISYEELMQWAQLYETEPWGQYPENARNAHIISTLANINRDTKKRDKPFELKEFMLFRPPEVKQESTDKGATIAPETAAWFFAMARKNKNG